MDSYVHVYMGRPQKRLDGYMSKMYSTNKTPLRLCLWDVQWMNLKDKGDGIALLSLFAPDTSIASKTLKQIDDAVKMETQKNNGTWFRNGLSKEQLTDFFRPTVQMSHPSFKVMCHTWKEPSFFIDGKVVENWRDMHVPAQANIRVEIEAQGVYFQKQRYGIRWILRKCWIQTLQEEEDLQVNRKSIEKYWRDELYGLQDLLSKEEQRLLQKIQRLHDYQKLLWDKYEKACSCEDERIWNDSFEELSKNIVGGHTTAFEKI